jgi:hypothetical protein
MCWTTGRSRFHPRRRRKDFCSSFSVQIGCEAHPASCTLGTGDPFPEAKARPERDADIHPHLGLRSRMSRSCTSSSPKHLGSVYWDSFSFQFWKNVQAITDLRWLRGYGAHGTVASLSVESSSRHGYVLALFYLACIATGPSQEHVINTRDIREKRNHYLATAPNKDNRMVGRSTNTFTYIDHLFIIWRQA